MAKGKRTKGQTTQWPKEKGQKDRQPLLLNGRLKDNNAPEGIKVTIVTGIYIIHHKLLVEFAV
jgi:hypothetical protein